MPRTALDLTISVVLMIIDTVKNMHKPELIENEGFAWQNEHPKQHTQEIHHCFLRKLYKKCNIPMRFIFHVI